MRDRELVLERVLADELVQRGAGAACASSVVLGALVRASGSAVGAGRADRLAAAPLAARAAIRSSGVSPGAPSSSLSASCGEKPRPTQAVAGEHPRVVAAR